MQSNLRSLFAGKREAVEVQPKRGPGRPPKVRKQEEVDAALERVQSQPPRHEGYEELDRLRCGDATTALGKLKRNQNSVYISENKISVVSDGSDQQFERYSGPETTAYVTPLLFRLPAPSRGRDGVGGRAGDAKPR